MELPAGWAVAQQPKRQACVCHVNLHGAEPVLPHGCSAACLSQAGWGKRLNYVIGVGRHGAVDVTRRYSRDYADTLRR